MPPSIVLPGRNIGDGHLRSAAGVGTAGTHRVKIGPHLRSDQRFLAGRNFGEGQVGAHGALAGELRIHPRDGDGHRGVPLSRCLWWAVKRRSGFFGTKVGKSPCSRTRWKGSDGVVERFRRTGVLRQPIRVPSPPAFRSEIVASRGPIRPTAGAAAQPPECSRLRERGGSARRRRPGTTSAGGSSR
jgi:hypothetical protein